MTKVLLASNSARRRDLIRLTGWDVSMTAADIDESRLPGEQAREYVLRLAREKATRIMPDEADSLILTADTIVVDQENIYGKPINADDARRMLQELRGHIHHVMTAIALSDGSRQELLTDLCVSSVPMRKYSVSEMEDYISSGDAMDKAGAYAIQNREFHPVEMFSGCFASVMGMPLCHLARMAGKKGMSVDRGLASRCQAAIDYECPIHDAVLRGDIIG
jgi:septum formation protein